MSITSEELAVIRSRPAYVAALYLERLTLVPMLLFFRAASTGATNQAEIIGTWGAAMAMIIGGLLLLHRSGVPFVRRGLSWQVRDKYLIRAMYVDSLVLWWPRKVPAAAQDRGTAGRCGPAGTPWGVGVAHHDFRAPYRRRAPAGSAAHVPA
ncbi:hypothetical protein QEZ54_09230 [Catellatospora sp. KI3]|uniref:hypothetical protein n=1 Tax=Catellatospora sp. KI3 TaxID=3041620 RepID=UPI002482FD9E|nr:hypothetical protein [Catellatospora sp. KI3]MDI1461146.1 hypothetical protein [Catellatospora sp. KI3]